MGYLMPKPSIWKDIWKDLTLSWGNKWVNTPPKGISSKMSIKALLEFELVYYDVTDQDFSHYAMKTPPSFEIDRLEWIVKSLSS